MRRICGSSSRDRACGVKRIQRVFGDIDALRFVDDRLDEDRRAAFVAHLADDPEAAERVQLWGRQNEALRAAFADLAAEPVPVWLRLGHLAAEQIEPIGSREAAPTLRRDGAKITRLAPAPHGRQGMNRVKTVAAAAVLVAAGAFSMMAAHTFLLSPHPFGDERTRLAADPGAALVARAVDAFRTFALDPVHPVEIASTQQVQLEHWLSRRLSLPIHAPDLRQEGWSLLGGRVAPGDIGPGALLVYENDANERMGLYIARTGAAPRPPSLSEMPGGSVTSWVSGPVGFVLAVGKDKAWMTRNADGLRTKVQTSAND